MVTITEEEYLRLKRQARSKGPDWFSVNSRAMSLDDAECILLFYLNKKQATAARNRNNPKRKVSQYVLDLEGEGFFWCTVRYLTNGIPWSEKKQQRTIRKLKSRGLVEMKLAGSPPQRFLRVDHEKMDELCLYSDMSKVSEHSQGGQNCPLQSGHFCPAKENTTYSLKNKGKLRVASRTRRGLNKTFSDLSNKEETTMPFLPKKPSVSDPNKQDHECARLLRDLCRKRNWAVSSQRTLWAKEFQLLRTKDLVHDPDRDKRVKRVLLFYLEQACSEECQKKNKLPPCPNGKTFRQRFNWIEERMGSGPVKVQEQEPVSKDAVKIAVYLNMFLNWPKGCGERLPRAVQSTMTRYERFRKGLVDVSSKLQDLVRGDPNHKDISTLKLCEKLLALYTETPPEFTKTWFTKVVHRQVSRWKNWNGNLDMFVFKIDHKDFVSDLERVTVHKGYKKTTVDRLMSMVGGGK